MAGGWPSVKSMPLGERAPLTLQKNLVARLSLESGHHFLIRKEKVYIYIFDIYFQIAAFLKTGIYIYPYENHQYISRSTSTYRARALFNRKIQTDFLHIYLLYTYRDLRAKKHRDKNSLFALEKPADWSTIFFTGEKRCIDALIGYIMIFTSE